MRNNKMRFLVFTLPFLFLICIYFPETRYDKLAKVNGKSMHAYIKGSGKQTVVMLSGWGTEEPIKDFMPLANAFKDYKIVILEYFGYGKSDITFDERSNKAFVEEIRECLRNLDIKPPYVFMPHSMSGLYTLYYANKYPEEVTAVIGLDQSIPQKQLERWTEETFGADKLNSKISDFNDSIINQWNMFYTNSKELSNVKYAPDIPVMLFLSTENIKLLEDMKKAEQIKTSWLDMNKNMITNPDIQFTKILDASHYVHHEALEEIVTASEKFIMKFCR